MEYGEPTGTRDSGYGSVSSKEAEVFALAQEMMTGLAANTAVYPSPPVAVAALAAAFGAYMTGKNAAVAAQAAAEQATTT